MKTIHLDKYKTIATNNLEILYWIQHNLYNYLQDNEENQTEIEHIIDFLLSDKSPKRLHKMSYEEAKTSAEKWTKSLIKRGNNTMETEEDIKGVLRFKKSGMRLVRLIGEDAYKREGFLMRNCVASYYGNNNCIIYSLRDSENMPHCTFEVTKDDNCIKQIKGKGNGSIHPKYIKYVLKCLKKIGKEINEYELTHLGYENLPSYYWEFLESTFINVQFLLFNGKKYFYKYSNLKKRR